MALIRVDGIPIADFRGRLPVRRGAARYPLRPLEGISMAVIHYSGVSADSSALEIAEYQTTKESADLFPECAYSFVVRWNGQVEQCHDLEVRSWHAGGWNNDAGIGICLPGSDQPADAQLTSTRALIEALNRTLGRKLRVVGHKDVSATACPGPSWEQWKGCLAARTEDCGLRTEWGFRKVYEYLGEERCGAPLTPEEYDGLGNSAQRFSRCEMRWNKAENRVWVAFSC